MCRYCRVGSALNEWNICIKNLEEKLLPESVTFKALDATIVLHADDIGRLKSENAGIVKRNQEILQCAKSQATDLESSSASYVVSTIPVHRFCIVDEIKMTLPSQTNCDIRKLHHFFFIHTAVVLFYFGLGRQSWRGCFSSLWTCAL